jgi:uncharacterized delta-60 repeat protein
LSGGRIALGGGFTTLNGIARNRVAVFNPDGSLDTAFDPGSGANGPVRAVIAQPDGKLVLGGSFSAFNGAKSRGIVRVDPTGARDTGFNPGTGVSGVVHVLALAPDGKIVIAGSFRSVGSSSRNNLARLNVDGSVDATFVPRTIAGPVYGLLVQEDGRVLVRGTFDSVDEATGTAFLTRLNPDGSPVLRRGALAPVALHR